MTGRETEDLLIIIKRVQSGGHGDDTVKAADQPADMQGRSIRPLLRGKTPKDWRTSMYYHYYEFPAVHMVKRHYGIVTREYKLVHFYYDVDEWELYDRRKDPLEMLNVYNDPVYAGVVEELKEKLAALRVKYKDSKELDQHYIDLYLEN